MKRNKKIKYYLFSILLISVSLIFLIGNSSFAGYPKLVNKFLEAFDKIKNYLIAVATPVAAIAIASGFLMQKFSLGDEEKIRNGKKLLKTSIISYTFILTLDLIISLIQTLVT